nr:MAG TPA: hypothetical protein [Caudoviricetes sp.]
MPWPLAPGYPRSGWSPEKVKTIDTYQNAPYRAKPA